MSEEEFGFSHSSKSQYCLPLLSRPLGSPVQNNRAPPPPKVNLLFLDQCSTACSFRGTRITSSGKFASRPEARFKQLAVPDRLQVVTQVLGFLAFGGCLKHVVCSLE